MTIDSQLRPIGTPSEGAGEAHSDRCSYLGSSTTFDVAVGEYASAYADQNEQDHRALLAALASGRVVTRTGV